MARSLRLSASARIRASACSVTVVVLAPALELTMTPRRVAVATSTLSIPAPVRETVHGYAAAKRIVVHYPDVLRGPGVPPTLREACRWMGFG